VDKYLILSRRNGSPLYSTTRTFNDEAEMQSYIEMKTKAGMICDRFDHNSTFVAESRIVKTLATEQ